MKTKQGIKRTGEKIQGPKCETRTEGQGAISNSKKHDTTLITYHFWLGGFIANLFSSSLSFSSFSFSSSFFFVRPTNQVRVALKGVDDGHGQRDDPDPGHLEDEEAQKGEEVVALVVKALVLADLEDAVQQVARDAHGPHAHQHRGHDLAGEVVVAQEQRHERQHEEVGAAGKVGHFVESELVRHREERQL